MAAVLSVGGEGQPPAEPLEAARGGQASQGEVARPCRIRRRGSHLGAVVVRGRARWAGVRACLERRRDHLEREAEEQKPDAARDRPRMLAHDACMREWLLTLLQ